MANLAKLLKLMFCLIVFCWNTYFATQETKRCPKSTLKNGLVVRVLNQPDQVSYVYHASKQRVFMIVLKPLDMKTPFVKGCKQAFRRAENSSNVIIDVFL